ncbi:MAG: toll/interleukin-1 receptor domain-containing protein [Pseudomonadota bacterium]
MSHEVFLSHSHVDKVFADAICHWLEAADIRCWVAPRDIRPSEDWAEAIINAMDHSKVLLLVFSSSSNSSPQVRREVERAVNKGLHVLPFRIENVPLSKSLEYFISTQHWLDAIDGDLESHLGQLRDCVAALLGRGAPAAPAIGPALRSTAMLPSEQLERLCAILARFIGPIAGHMVRRAAVPGRSAQEVVDALACELEDDGERRQFLTQCGAALR